MVLASSLIIDALQGLNEGYIVSGDSRLWEEFQFYVYCVPWSCWRIGVSLAVLSKLKITIGRRQGGAHRHVSTEYIEIAIGVNEGLISPVVANASQDVLAFQDGSPGKVARLKRKRHGRG